MIVALVKLHSCYLGYIIPWSIPQISTPTVDEKMMERKEIRKKQMEEMEKQREVERLKGKERMSWVGVILSFINPI